MSLAGEAAHVRTESGLWQDSWFFGFLPDQAPVGVFILAGV